MYKCDFLCKWEQLFVKHVHKIVYNSFSPNSRISIIQLFMLKQAKQFIKYRAVAVPTCTGCNFVLLNVWLIVFVTSDFKP